jgi:hypothetical protein
LGGSGGSSRERFPSPIRRSTSETVESAIASSSAISAAVIRSRLSAAIARTSRGGVAFGLRLGREQRS